MTEPLISVIICTHNPRTDYLTRVLSALGMQTLQHNKWELLVIDNASQDPVAPRFNLSWCPLARHVREDEIGLAAARLRGIAESRGDILLFVDDDNVLGANYVEQAERIGREYPWIGAWGGSAIAEFEVPPEPWALTYVSRLAIRECKRDTWSNLLTLNESVPHGAGMCIRRSIAERYARELQELPIRKALGRSGKALAGFEDLDMAITSCRVGLGTGVFSDLRLTHLIPAFRLTKDYFLRLVRETESSLVLFQYTQTNEVPSPQSQSLLQETARWLRERSLPAFDREVSVARRKGHAEGILLVQRLARSPSLELPRLGSGEQ